MTHSLRSNCDPFKAQLPIEVSLSSECTDIVVRLESHYGIEVTVPADRFEVVFEHDQYLTIIEGQPASESAANRTVAVFEEEFGLYPRSLVRNTRLTRVVLCGELFRSQKPNPRARKRNSSPAVAVRLLREPGKHRLPSKP